MRYHFIKSWLARSVERPFYKTWGVAGSKPFFFLFSLNFIFFFFFIIIVILDYCKVDYKVFIFVNNKLIYLSRMESCLWWWSCYNNSLAQRPISHRIHSFLVSDVSAESTTAVANLQVACPYHVRVDLGFYSGRARPIEVFKLVSNAPRLELRSHAQVRTQARTQASAHVLLITMALKQN